jgi:hypothetical protein
MLLAKLLDACRPGVAAHEHLAVITGNEFVRVATAYYEGRASRAEVRAQLQRYGADPVRIDSNWKLTWTIDVLREVVPDARILHVTRAPGPNVAACMSLDYYGAAIASASPARLREVLAPAFPGADLAQVTKDLTDWYGAFPRLRHPDFDRWSQHTRNCAFWAETHRLILTHAASQPGYLRVQLEALRDLDAVRAIADFFELPAPPPDRIRTLLATRVNDHAGLRAIIAALRPAPPADEPDDDAALASHCGDLARTLGYV